MKRMKATFAILAGSLLLAGLGGCVDQEPSLSLRGSVAFTGSYQDTTDSQGNTVKKLVCDYSSAKPGSIDTFFFRANVDVTELKGNGSNNVPQGYFFWGDIKNLLEQSTQVGTGATGGGNFQGLSEDQNSIMITGATIRYPSSLNKFPGAQYASQLEKKELFSAVVDSGGGAALASFPIFSSRELPKVEKFYNQVIEASPNIASGTKDAIIPLVAEIQLKGQTFSGRSVESNKFQFPINICLDCPPPSAGAPDPFSTTPACVASK